MSDRQTTTRSRTSARGAAWLLGFFGLLGLGGCVETRTQRQVSAPGGEVIFSDRDAQWLVNNEQGQPLGYLLRFRPRAEAPAYHAVVTLHLQDVGQIDALGRWWQYVPHQAEPQLLGTGTVLEGVRQLMGCAGEPLLVSLEELPEPGVTAPGVQEAGSGPRGSQ